MAASRRHALFALFSLALALVAHEPIRGLFALALGSSESRDLSHILVVPFVSAALIYFNRRSIFRNTRTSILPAAGVFSSSAILYYFARAYRPVLSEYDDLVLVTASLIVCWFAGFVLVYGCGAFKSALFPLLFMTLAIPVPQQILDALMVFLQKGSAVLVSFLLTLTGTPFYRTGTVFTLPRVVIEVAEACSGIRSTIGMLIITLIASHSLLRSNSKKAALLIAVIPVSIFKNAVRIVTLTLLATQLDMSFLTGDLHHEGGILFMLGGLCLMYPLLAVLVRSEYKRLHAGVRP